MNLEEFKNNFPGKGTGSLSEIIDFIWKEKDVLYQDAINVGVFSRLSRKKAIKKRDFVHLLKYLNKMKAIEIIKDRIIVNDSFVPLSQRK